MIASNESMSGQLIRIRQGHDDFALGASGVRQEFDTGHSPTQNSGAQAAEFAQMGLVAHQLEIADLGPHEKAAVFAANPGHLAAGKSLAGGGYKYRTREFDRYRQLHLL